MTDRELMQQALEALEWCQRRYEGFGPEFIPRSISALREALEQPGSVKLPTTADEAELMTKAGLMWLEQNAPDRLEQPQQEPVAWQWLTTAHFRKHLPKDAEPGAWTPLYTAPPRREWVGLIRGVRVEGDTVVVSVKGGNENARLLCGELLREKSA